jgi:hypothetical protein
MTHDGRPVVALDFDGVLNPRVAQAPAGYTRHQVELLLPDAPPPYLKVDRTGLLTGEVLINPDHGRWIAELRKQAEVVWASTWERVANMVIAPLLGIEPLPLGVDSALRWPKFTEDSPPWKARSLIATYGQDRPLVWVDDHAGPWAETFRPPSEAYLQFLRQHNLSADTATADRWRQGPTLVITPEPTTGLTEEQMAEIAEFVAGW